MTAIAAWRFHYRRPCTTSMRRSLAGYCGAAIGTQNTVRHSVVNEGIGGNTVTRNVTPARARPAPMADRDVLAHAGVSHVVVFMGTNDIRREASAEQGTNGEGHCPRVKARLKVGGAQKSRHSQLPAIPANAKTKVRNEVNA
jgi:hypothetical protein